LLGFAKLPDHALAVVARVVEVDEEFRARVAMAAGEDDVGRAGFVYLTRPEGWEGELAQLTEAAGVAAAAAADEQAERQARRRLRGAEDARQEAERALAEARAELARAANDLETERRLRRQAEARLASAEAERERLRAAADRAQAERAAAEAERAAAEAGRAAAEAERAASAAERAAAAEQPVPAAVDDSRARAAAVEAAEAAMARATDAVVAVEQALAEAARALKAGIGDAAGHGGGAPATEPAGPTDAARPIAPPAVNRGDVGPRASVTGGGLPGRLTRRPAPLPPAVFEDSAEAAEHLVRYPGVAVLVDGYNVGFLAWPQLPVPEIRHRLVDALGELAARTGAEVHVVFDGADGIDASPHAGSGRSPVRVRFSPPDVEADDVIIGLAGSLPADRPVVVATNDRRVQDQVRVLGARTLSSGQFLGVLGRARGG
jgi:predicted RNA-binding protein with PIN domain